MKVALGGVVDDGWVRRRGWSEVEVDGERGGFVEVLHLGRCVIG